MVIRPASIWTFTSPSGGPSVPVSSMLLYRRRRRGFPRYPVVVWFTLLIKGVTRWL